MHALFARLGLGSAELRPARRTAHWILAASLAALSVASLPARAAAQCTSGQMIATADTVELYDFPGLNFLGAATPSGDFPREIAIGQDRLVYIASWNQNRVYRRDQAGNFLGAFVTSGLGGLNRPNGLAFLPNGDLLVVSTGTNQILRYSPSGAFLGIFVNSIAVDPNGGAGLRNGVAVGPGGDVFVANRSPTFDIRRYDGTTGALLRIYPIGLLEQTDIAFDRQGILHVLGDGGLYTLDPLTGAFALKTSLGAGARPQVMAFGPQDYIAVTDAVTRQLSVVDPRNGAIVRQTPAPGLPTRGLLLPCPLSVGDLLFLDANDSGQFDVGEATAPAGITLSLLDDTGNPVDGDLLLAGVQPATAVTDANGGYLFDDLLFGRYAVRIDASNFASGALLDGFVSSTGATAATGLVSENGFDHGLDAANPSATGITSGVLDLDHDIEPLGEGPPSPGSGFATDDDSDLTIDFGLVAPVAPSFDLALIKQVAAGQPATFAAGDDVTFRITVFNQGGVDATSVSITDTLPAGFVLSPADSNGWASGGATASVVLPGTLASGAQAQIDIVLRVTAAAVVGTATNFAEIDSALDGAAGPVTDIDSTPDAVSGNTQGEVAPALEDDQVNENGTVVGEDEDDHDLASVEIVASNFDLALVKQLAPGQPAVFSDGDDVTFRLFIVNQGDVDASAISLTDTLPTGVILSPADSNGWTSGGGTATVTLPGTLAAGASTSIDIVLQVTGAAPLGTTDNFAEISAALDGASGAVVDVDSTPDTVSGNTPGEVAPALEDDQIGEDGTQPGQDEDDHDVESFEVVAVGTFDLALIKTLAPTQVRLVDLGDDVEYVVTVFNQGTVPATGIELTDTLPPGFALSPNDTNGWVASGGTATVTLAGPLAPGANLSVGLVLQVDPAAAPGDYDNFTEISAALDGGVAASDVDSTADSISGNTQGEVPPALEDNQINEDGTVAGQDEDDHDVASVTVVPGSAVVLYSVGDTVWLDVDGDGAQSAGEPGIPGVSVRILDALGNALPPAVLGASDVQTTDSQGRYSFLLLAEGIYIVEVQASNFAPAGALASRLSSSGSLQSTNPNDDVDGDDNGIDAATPAVTGVRSNPITINAGLEPVGEPGNPGTGVLDEDSNFTLDFGFVDGGSPPLYPVPAPEGLWLVLFAGLLSALAWRMLRA